MYGYTRGVYRTRTYIAAEWDGDKDAVEQLHKWNDNNYWGLSFSDAHDMTQSKDSSLNCTIKGSLKKRLDGSKTFVLIVGENTDKVTAGACRYCGSYNSWTMSCARYYSVDQRSFIKYECDKAAEAYRGGVMKIVVLYNSTVVSKSKCPEAVRNIGTHIPMVYKVNGDYYWDYQAVKNALEG